jgi:hypothetical protein
MGSPCSRCNSKRLSGADQFLPLLDHAVLAWISGRVAHMRVDEAGRVALEGSGESLFAQGRNGTATSRRRAG